MSGGGGGINDWDNNLDNGWYGSYYPYIYRTNQCEHFWCWNQNIPGELGRYHRKRQGYVYRKESSVVLGNNEALFETWQKDRSLLLATIAMLFSNLYFYKQYQPLWSFDWNVIKHTHLHAISPLSSKTKLCYTKLVTAT